MSKTAKPSLQTDSVITSLARRITPIPRLCKVTLVKSPIKARKEVKQSIQALGLSRANTSRVHKNVSSIRGMINTAKYYVTVEDITLPLPEFAEKPTSMLDNPPLTDEIPSPPGSRTEPFPMEEMFPKKKYTLEDKVIYPYPRSSKVIEQFNQIKQEFESNNNTKSSSQEK